MNKFILVLVFALVACDMDIDAIMFQQFQKFIKKYQKKYNSVNEFLARYEVFRRNVMETFKEENSSYRSGITKFSDLTQQEFAKTYLNLNYDALAVANFNPHIVKVSNAAPLLKFQMLLLLPGIGEIKDMSHLLKIKDHADHAGPSQLLLT